MYRSVRVVKIKLHKCRTLLQDLEVRFNTGDRVFWLRRTAFAQVREIFDEEWLELQKTVFKSI